jgi:hypothetical protein
MKFFHQAPPTGKDPGMSQTPSGYMQYRYELHSLYQKGLKKANKSYMIARSITIQQLHVFLKGFSDG